MGADSATAIVALGGALLLGLASGPACLAACGPVLGPWLLAERGGWRAAARSVAAFLGGRLAGYLAFAVVAWEMGALVTLPPAWRGGLTGCLNVLLGMALLGYAWAGFRNKHACAAGLMAKGSGPRLVTIGGGTEGARAGARLGGSAALGLLTGLNLCPPFVAAGVGAAQQASVGRAMLFFAAFFVGTSIWFVPLAGVGWVAKSDQVMLVARITMALVAVFYLATGAALWWGGVRHVY